MKKIPFSYALNLSSLTDFLCRFDVEVDDGMQFNFPSGEHTQIPTTTIPSPPPQQEPQRGDDHATTLFFPYLPPPNMSAHALVHAHTLCSASFAIIEYVNHMESTCQ